MAENNLIKILFAVIGNGTLFKRMDFLGIRDIFGNGGRLGRNDHFASDINLGNNYLLANGISVTHSLILIDELNGNEDSLILSQPASPSSIILDGFGLASLLFPHLPRRRFPR